MHVYRFGAGRVVAASLILGAAGVFAVPSASQATSGTLVITTNTTLAEEHQGSIIVDADGVTLDCAGHSVSGPGDFGILLNGRSGVTVTGCDVSGFVHGFGLVASGSNTLTHNASHHNTFGFVLNESSRNVVSNNAASNNAAEGFVLIASRDNSLTNNAATNNGTSAAVNGFVLVAGSNGNLLGHNVAVSGGADDGGFRIDVSDNNQLRDNVANGNGPWGFLIYRSAGSLLDGNLANNNRGAGFALNSTTKENTLTGNSARNNEVGVDLLLSDSNVLSDNVFSNNIQGGVHVASSTGNQFSRNAADNNGIVGFDVFFDSHFNVFAQNEGCRNAIYDAQDAGTGNVWLDNSFCTTSGI
jgi:parallel beta-helix repeat protein